MDWAGIIILSISGAFGAVAGAVVGAVFARARSFLGKWSRLFLVLSGILAGVIFLPTPLGPLVRPLMADYAVQVDSSTRSIFIAEPREEISETAIADAIAMEISDLGDPFFEAVLQREPNRAEAVKSRLVSAYKQGGRPRLVAELLKADQEIIETAFPFYMARAQESDLLSAVSEISKIIKLLGLGDPETCHLWLYGGLVGLSFDYDKYIAVVGEAGNLALQEKLAAAVMGAEDILPEYDEDQAFRILSEIREKLTAELGPEKIGLITAGQPPANKADTQLACDASARFYDLVMISNIPADALRHRYVAAGI